MDFITAHFSEIVSLIVGLIGGGTIGSLVTFKFVGGQRRQQCEPIWVEGRR